MYIPRLVLNLQFSSVFESNFESNTICRVTTITIFHITWLLSLCLLQILFSDLSSSMIPRQDWPVQGEEGRTLRSVQKVNFLQGVGGREDEAVKTGWQGGQDGRDEQGSLSGKDRRHLEDVHGPQGGGGHGWQRGQ